MPENLDTECSSGPPPPDLTFGKSHVISLAWSSPGCDEAPMGGRVAAAGKGHHSPPHVVLSGVAPSPIRSLSPLTSAFPRHELQTARALSAQ